MIPVSVAIEDPTPCEHCGGERVVAIHGQDWSHVRLVPCPFCSADEDKERGDG